MFRNKRSFSGSRGFSGGRKQFYGGRNSGKSRKIVSFDPSLLVSQAQEPVAADVYETKNRFNDFDLDQDLKKNILAKGYEKPTPIQDQAIPVILGGRDVVGIANTGTGKTAAFLIPLVNKLMRNTVSRVLIMVPTRELAIQVQGELRDLSRNMSLFSSLCIGGATLYRQAQELQRKPDFVIGTPGRLKDLYQRGEIKFAEFDTIVLDEVDRMLDMGFINDVKLIVGLLAKERQSLFFSATLSGKVESVMAGFLNNPELVKVGAVKTSANVNQDVVRLGGKAKVEVLHELLIGEGFEKVLVFGRTKRGVEQLRKQLKDRGFRVDSIHGNKSLGQRKRALMAFKNNQIQALLATDVVSRGVDIDNVTHVINYDLPETYEDYVHRIGRTGRADRTGVALTLID